MAPRASHREEHLALVDQLRAKLATAALGGPKRARERHVSRGKLLPRDRVDGLLDPGSPFLEVAPLDLHPGLLRERASLDAVIARSFSDGEERMLASVEDRQGIGAPRKRNTRVDTIQRGGLSNF